MKERAPLTFDRFATLLLLAVSFALACLTPAQNDTWWQLRAGREIWHTGHVPTVDSWSFTANGRAWPDHEWLWQVGAYALHSIGGMPLLSLAQAVVAVGAVAVALRLGGPSGRAGPVLLLLAVPLVSAEWSLRPQVVSLLMFVVLLRLVARERFWAVPALFLVWANLHAAVSTGGILLVAVTVLAGVEHLHRRDPTSRRRLVTLASVTVLSALATLLSPLGIGLWGYVLGATHDPAHAWIADWRGAFHVGGLELAFWTWFAALVVLAVVRRHRFRRWDERVVLVAAAATSVLPMVALRNVGFFVLAALPALVIATRSATPTTRTPADDSVTAGRSVLAGVGVVLAALVLLAWLNPPARLGWQPMSRPAAEAVERCPGRIFNTYDDGGYLLWFTPDVKVFVDSRQDPYSTDFLRQTLFFGGAQSFLDQMQRYDVRCAVLSPSDSTQLVTLSSAGWRTAYRDAQWVVLTRNS